MDDGCKNCECERKLRVGEDYMDGFCKCTGDSITIIEHEHRPEWCPLQEVKVK